MFSLTALKKIILGIGILVLGFYGYTQTQPFLSGPQIHVTAIELPSENTPLALVRGEATYITKVTLNSREIFINPEGVFEEPLLLLPGYNIMTLTAQDRFGRMTTLHKQLFIGT